jgi:hypothetical protein
VADGWIGTSFIPEQAEEVFFKHIRAGAAKAGRSIGDIDLQAGGAIGFTDDLQRVVARHRPGLAFTLGAMGSKEHNFYNAAFRRAGYEEEALAVQRLWLEGKRKEAADLVPEEMVFKVNLLGTEDMVRDRIRAYHDAGVTRIRAPEGASMQEPGHAGAGDRVGEGGGVGRPGPRRRAQQAAPPTRCPGRARDEHDNPSSLVRDPAAPDGQPGAATPRAPRCSDTRPLRGRAEAWLRPYPARWACTRRFRSDCGIPLRGSGCAGWAAGGGYPTAPRSMRPLR